ncbi:serine O-acetyltransferase EpsC [Mucilaginibacter sp.]
MDEHFYRELFDKHSNVDAVPSNKEITSWALNVIRLLFPEHSKQVFASVQSLKDEFERLENELCHVMEATKACWDCDIRQLSRSVFEQLPELYAVLKTDIQAIYSGDPAARTEFEVIRSYPGFFAISFYRLAHILHMHDIPLVSRVLTEHAHSKTGIDIHPAAQIGEYFYIDHGTGIVIGESSVIGKHVKLYQGVTLGALSVAKNMAFTKRHPTVEDHVVIYSGATILGGETVIGHDSVIGGNVWLTQSVEPHSTVYHKPLVNVINKTKV